MPWVSPSIRVKWGPYFRTDPEEQTKIVAFTQAALGGTAGVQLITKRTAVEKLASVFDSENVDAIMEALEEEQAEKDAKAEKDAQRELDAAVTQIAAKAGSPGTGKGAPAMGAPKDRDSGRTASG